MESQQTALRLFEQLSGAGQRKLELLWRLPFKPKFPAKGHLSLRSWLPKEALHVRLSLVALSFMVLLSGMVSSATLVIAAVAAGLFVGASYGWSLMRANSQHLLTSPNVSRIASFHYDGVSLTASPHADVPSLVEGGMRNRLLAAALGGLASAIVLISGAAKLSTLLDQPQSFRWARLIVVLVLCLSPLAVSALIFGDRHLQIFLTSRLKRQIGKLISATNAELHRIREIDSTVTAIAALCEILNAQPSTEYSRAVARFISKNSAAVVLSPMSLTSFIQTIDELARQDLANLMDLMSVHQRLRSQLLLTGAAVEDSRNPHLELQLESLTSQASALGNLLPQRRWDEFRGSSTQAIEQLKKLQEEALRRKLPAVVLPPGSDPYRILGIERAMPTSELRKLRTRLALIYHPDAAEGFSNSSKMAEINAAFDAVMSERKQA